MPFRIAPHETMVACHHVSLPPVYALKLAGEQHAQQQTTLNYLAETRMQRVINGGQEPQTWAESIQVSNNSFILHASACRCHGYICKAVDRVMSATVLQRLIGGRADGASFM